MGSVVLLPPPPPATRMASPTSAVLNVQLSLHSCAGCLLRGRFRTVRAQRAHSANYYVVYPGNTPANHPPTEACMIHSKQHRGCSIQDPGTCSYRWWKTADFLHSARCSPSASPLGARSRACQATPPSTPSIACIALHSAMHHQSETLGRRQHTGLAWCSHAAHYLPCARNTIVFRLHRWLQGRATWSRPAYASWHMPHAPWPTGAMVCRLPRGWGVFGGGGLKLGGGGDLELVLRNEGDFWYKAPCCC